MILVIVMMVMMWMLLIILRMIGFIILSISHLMITYITFSVTLNWSLLLLIVGRF